MKKVLVLGAGRSSSALIAYLLEHAAAHDWQITVGDVDQPAAQARIGSASRARAIHFDVANEARSYEVIRQADVVISMIPASLHPLVAKWCLAENKHLLTASYVSDEMKALDQAARGQGLLFLNECGLDPGIDHMSAMQLINKIRIAGGQITSFESFTGGLIAPETARENPWRYKFTWNPRNVVLAGQGTAKYLQDGKFKYIPYQQLFSRLTPVSVPGLGDYEGYANRDSLKYVDAYGLQDCRSVVRGTLRNKGYCGAWNILAQLGCCDDTYQMANVGEMTHRSFLTSFMETDNVEAAICQRFGLSVEGSEMLRLRWSGFFEAENIGIEKGTPAQILEHILNKKWKLHPGDKDFVVMWHRFKYELAGHQQEIQAWLTATGEDETQTAMAKTVGLPLAIACKLLLTNKLTCRGVALPLQPEVYEPVLQELSGLGIHLHEQETQF